MMHSCSVLMGILNLLFHSHLLRVTQIRHNSSCKVGMVVFVCDGEDNLSKLGGKGTGIIQYATLACT